MPPLGQQLHPHWSQTWCVSSHCLSGRTPRCTGALHSRHDEAAEIPHSLTPEQDEPLSCNACASWIFYADTFCLSSHTSS
eukprot:4271025-Amphidinium_carterae.1